MYFTLAKVPFDLNDGFHKRILLRIYSILKGQDQLVFSFEDADWESLGFQNRDNVASDFRSAGILGLVNLLYFIDRKCTSYSDIRSMYQLSLD